MKLNQILHFFNLGIYKPYPRQSIKFMRRHFKERKDLIGAEVGVWKGDNAKSILRNLFPKKMYLIDPYIESGDFTTDKKAKKRLKNFKNLIWIKKKFEDFEKDILDKLDFIYIDGSHFYKDVKKDLELAYKIVKKGGIIAGHDINQKGRMLIIKPQFVNECGVLEAVVEFTNKHQLECFVDGEDFWFIKK